MSVDYDLIILGATPAGIQTAIAAATLKARVALITQDCSPHSAPELIPHHGLLHLAHQADQWQHVASLPFWSADSKELVLQGAQVTAWMAAVVGNVATVRSVAALAAYGVDVIPGLGEFCRKPAPGVVVGQRFLQARGYLLAVGSRPRIPAIAGLDTVNYFTPETLPTHLGAIASAATIAVLGAGKTAVELAQALNHLGHQVILLTEQRSLLPDADREVAQWLQAHLEAAGVQVWLQAAIKRVQQLPPDSATQTPTGQKRLWLGTKSLDVDELAIAAGQTPNLASLNLEAVAVRWTDQGIVHNQKLQTTNARIYACEGRVGSECFTQLANHEAAIALKNILFFPRSRLDRQRVPFTVHTSPELAWIGLTTEQATQQYGNHQVYTLRQPCSILPSAQLQNDLSGFCQLIVHRNGTLLGAHLVGNQVSAAIAVLALAMQQRLKIGAIAALPFPTPTMTEILHHTAADFRRLQFKHTPWLQDLVDHFFDLRRAWSRNSPS
ncbi:MAG: NAD(P)/FAD-dependent oxidoreductase [Leptolyngbyaceae cyanobacterium bins.349]|nr:NAD(P)/FAD-dependent oxidoreductase [Leptolyngbyaceae cyanobacterium bins.349]